MTLVISFNISQVLYTCRAISETELFGDFLRKNLSCLEGKRKHPLSLYRNCQRCALNWDHRDIIVSEISRRMLRVLEDGLQVQWAWLHARTLSLYLCNFRIRQAIFPVHQDLSPTEETNWTLISISLSIIRESTSSFFFTSLLFRRGLWLTDVFYLFQDLGVSFL